MVLTSIIGIVNVSIIDTWSLMRFTKHHASTSRATQQHHHHPPACRCVGGMSMSRHPYDFTWDQAQVAVYVLHQLTSINWSFRICIHHTSYHHRARVLCIGSALMDTSGQGRAKVVYYIKHKVIPQLYVFHCMWAKQRCLQAEV